MKASFKNLILLCFSLLFCFNSFGMLAKPIPSPMEKLKLVKSKVELSKFLQHYSGKAKGITDILKELASENVNKNKHAAWEALREAKDFLKARKYTQAKEASILYSLYKKKGATASIKFRTMKLKKKILMNKRIKTDVRIWLSDTYDRAIDAMVKHPVQSFGNYKERISSYLAADILVQGAKELSQIKKQLNSKRSEINRLRQELVYKEKNSSKVETGFWIASSVALLALLFLGAGLMGKKTKGKSLLKGSLFAGIRYLSKVMKSTNFIIQSNTGKVLYTSSGLRMEDFSKVSGSFYATSENENSFYIIQSKNLKKLKLQITQFLEVSKEEILTINSNLKPKKSINMLDQFENMLAKTNSFTDTRLLGKTYVIASGDSTNFQTSTKVSTVMRSVIKLLTVIDKRADSNIEVDFGSKNLDSTIDITIDQFRFGAVGDSEYKNEHAAISEIRQSLSLINGDISVKNKKSLNNYQGIVEISFAKNSMQVKPSKIHEAINEAH